MFVVDWERGRAKKDDKIAKKICMYLPNNNDRHKDQIRKIEINNNNNQIKLLHEIVKRKETTSCHSLCWSKLDKTVRMAN